MSKNIYNISSNYNFLESFVYFILKKSKEDPIYLSKTTILLPSRRSCRIIKEIFLKQNKINAVILPNIKAIGDFDVEEINFTGSISLKALNIKPTSTLKYRCLLIEEIRKFNQKSNFFGKNITTNQIDLIANNLDDFLQEIQREELDLDNLENIDDTNLASHKQKILDFLRNFGSNWRNILIRNNLDSSTAYQNKIIDLNTQFITENGSEFPIFIAGSTGSLPATARLIKTISDLNNGFVFLPNLDKNITPEILAEIGENHPQFMLHKLLKTLEIQSNQVQDVEFEQFKQSSENLKKLLYYAFLPAQKTQIWTKITDLDKKSIENLTLIECRNNFDEATIISLIMVKYLQEDMKNNIALVTSDKNLAMMVKEILNKFNINIDNSNNNSLERSEFANYLLSISQLFNCDFKVSNLLTILKNRITKAGFEDDFYNKNLKIFELEILRKFFSLRNIQEIEKRIIEFSDNDLQKWFCKIVEILNIFNSSKNETNFLRIILKNLECARNLSKNSKNEESLNRLAGASEFLNFLGELRDQNPNFVIENEIYHKLLRQFISSYNFEKKQNHHPRLHILSPIEARIMNFEIMIISNLNEGEFIAQVKTQNWLSRKMRLDFGLCDITRRTGISAFDFCNYLGNKKVFLTRSATKNNTPTVKLRFLLKLETVLKAVNSDFKIDSGKYWHFLLEQFNYSQKFKIIKKDYPNPPLENRLKHISATDISKWIRDPYYIYAKRILKLKPLNKIDEEASFANFGNFVHEVLENFIKDYDKINANNRLETLTDNYGKKYFQKYFTTPESYLLWWSRFKNIANWFVKNEEEIRKDLKETKTELALKANIDGVEITTKIDRINYFNNGHIEIIDYKTGLLPTHSDVKQGFEPQLPIESLIFLLNHENLNKNLINSLQYYSLKGRDQNKIDNPEKNTSALIEAANIGICELIKIFNQNQTPFYSSPNPDIYKEDDYHHLARIDDN